MKNKNSYFSHNDGRFDYDVLITEYDTSWILKEEYYEFNGEVKPQNNINHVDLKKYQDLFDEIEKKCLSGNLTSIAREINL